MISDEQAMIRAVLADPADDVPRLVFADWYDDRGLHRIAELFRQTCESL